MRNSARTFTLIAALVAAIIVMALIRMRAGNSLSDAPNVPASPASSAPATPPKPATATAPPPTRQP